MSSKGFDEQTFCRALVLFSKSFVRQEFWSSEISASESLAGKSLPSKSFDEQESKSIVQQGFCSSKILVERECGG